MSKSETLDRLMNKQEALDYLMGQFITYDLVRNRAILVLFGAIKLYGKETYTETEITDLIYNAEKMYIKYDSELMYKFNLEVRTLI